MDSKEYLSRIKYSGPTDPTIETLTALHLAHMYAVPFENLDIPLGVEITLDFEKIYKKVVGKNRGGFCYELNGLFGWLLTSIGFDIEMFSARVFGGDGEPGPDFDHMLLSVNKEFIADVGFGDSFTRPLRFDKSEQVQETGTYRLTEEGATWQLERDTGDGYEPQYLFTTFPRAFNEFGAMCNYQQTSPDSIFTKKIVCSMANADGRMTYANGRVIETRKDKKRESDISGPDELKSELYSRFGFELSDGYDILIGKTDTASQ